MILYVGDTGSTKVHNLLNSHCFCVDSGRRGRRVFPTGSKVLMDSGAFADVRRGRITPAGALIRQLELEASQEWTAERLVSYDRLIDEQVVDGTQKKIRWTEDQAWCAVEDTIYAAEYLASKRTSLMPRQLVLSCQGVTPRQYEECAKTILRYAGFSDCFGLGGWCILGRRRTLFPEFKEVVKCILPLVKAVGMNDVHLFGVAWAPALIFFANECRRLGLNPSTDTNRFLIEVDWGYRFDPLTGRSPKVLDKPFSPACYASNINLASEWISAL